MTLKYTFYFNSSACSGCKACQIACRDKHGLNDGQTWRRVVEVTGGGWRAENNTWIPDVFAYNLSISCNHCENPICAEVCPSGAIQKRDDGIVILDTDACLGCEYCRWACPYGVLHMDEFNGCMTKCTFCADNIDSGLPPECVAACPMRVLDFGDRQTLEIKYGGSAPTYPLPENNFTEPALLVHPHKDNARSLKEPVTVSAPQQHLTNATPLVFFTLMAQMIMGAILVSGLMQLFGIPDTLPDYWYRMGIPRTGIIMLGALMISLVHLGIPLKAFRAVANARSSWLSREIMFACGFTILLLIIPHFTSLSGPASGAYVILYFCAVLAGLGMVYSMARIYMLRTLRRWNNKNVLWSYILTAVVLGNLLICAANPWTPLNIADSITFITVLCFFIAYPVLWFIRWKQRRLFKVDGKYKHTLSIMRILLPLAGICITLIQLLPNSSQVWDPRLLPTTAFILIFSSEIIERYVFYQSYERTGI